MERKQKKFFRRKNLKNTDESYSNVDICNVNVVSEAEKIVEEYVSRMGYRTAQKKNSAAKTALIITAGVFAFWAVVALFLKIFPG